MNTLDTLLDRIGQLSIKALEVGGETLLLRVESTMGPAIRHSERIRKGLLKPTTAVLHEMKTAIDLAELRLHDYIEAKRWNK